MFAMWCWLQPFGQPLILMWMRRAIGSSIPSDSTRSRTAAHNRVFGRGNSGTIPPARTLPGAVLPAGLAADFVARQLQPSGE